MAQTRGRPRDRERTDRRREQLLCAAAAVFARRGYPDTDVQEIADRCRVAKGTVYFYFPSKEKLFLAAVDRVMGSLREFVHASFRDVPDPLDRIATAIRAYLTYFQDHPDHAELFIIERAEFRERKTPTYLEHRRANAATWRDLYAGLIAAGRVRDVPTDRILTVVGDLLYGTMFTNHFSGHHRPVEDQARDVLDILFHGLLTPAERDRRTGE
jgi:AcrR family transcriptional regulator